MSLHPALDRRKTPRIAGMVVTHPDPTSASPIPPEAGNVRFGGDESADDDWRPVTWRQIAVFWAIVLVAGAITLTASVLAGGYACGMTTREIFHTVLSGGFV